MWVSISIDWFLSIERTRISEIQLHPCQTPALYPFFALDGKFLETGTQAAKCPMMGMKKEGKCPALN